MTASPFRNASWVALAALLLAIGCAPPTTTKPAEEAALNTKTKPRTPAPGGSPKGTPTPAPKTTPTPGGGTPGPTGTGTPGPGGTATPKPNGTATPGGLFGGDPSPTPSASGGEPAATAKIIYAGAFEASVLAGGKGGGRLDGTGEAAGLGQPISGAGMAIEAPIADGQPPLLLFSDPGGDQIRTIDLATGAVKRVAGASSDAGVQNPSGNPAGLALDVEKKVVIFPQTNDRGISRQDRPLAVGEAPGSVIKIAGFLAADTAYRDGDGKNADATKQASFSAPAGMAFVGGKLYVADRGFHTIRRMETGTPYAVTFVAGGKGTKGAPIDAAASDARDAARFDGPTALAALGTDTLLVADTNNHCIRAIDLKAADGKVTVFAGQPGTAGHDDGGPGVAGFDRPVALATDKAGNVYVGELGTPRVRRIGPDKQVVTLSGVAQPGFAKGARDAASYGAIVGLAVEADAGGAVKAIYAFDAGPKDTGPNVPGPRMIKLAPK